MYALSAKVKHIEIAEEILQTQHRKESAKQLIQAVSLIKNGASFETAELSEEVYISYCSRLRELGRNFDFDDLLLEAQNKLSPPKNNSLIYWWMNFRISMIFNISWCEME